MMSRNAKIAGVAAVAGLMFVVAVETFREPGHRPLDAVLPLLDEGDARTLLARELARCATLTMPDKDCETAWAEKRRRFFGRDSDTPAPGKDASLPAAYDSTNDNSAESDGSRTNEAIRPELDRNFVDDQAGSTVP